MFRRTLAASRDMLKHTHTNTHARARTHTGHQPRQTQVQKIPFRPLRNRAPGGDNFVNGSRVDVIDGECIRFDSVLAMDYILDHRIV